MFLILLRALLTTLGILGVSNEIIYVLIKQSWYKILQKMPGSFISWLLPSWIFNCMAPWKVAFAVQIHCVQVMLFI